MKEVHLYCESVYFVAKAEGQVICAWGGQTQTVRIAFCMSVTWCDTTPYVWLLFLDSSSTVFSSCHQFKEYETHMWL